MSGYKCLTHCECMRACACVERERGRGREREAASDGPHPLRDSRDARADASADQRRNSEGDFRRCLDRRSDGDPGDPVQAAEATTDAEGVEKLVEVRGTSDGLLQGAAVVGKEAVLF